MSDGTSTSYATSSVHIVPLRGSVAIVDPSNTHRRPLATRRLLVKLEANKRLQGSPTIEAYDVDSKAMDLVQLADLVASSIQLGRVKSEAPEGKRNSPKMKVAMRLRRAFELDSFDDVQRGKVNILMMGDLVDAEKLPGLD